MNHQEASGNSQQAQTEATRQPWVTPAFERVELKEALSGIGGAPYDGFSYDAS